MLPFWQYGIQFASGKRDFSFPQKSWSVLGPTQSSVLCVLGSFLGYSGQSIMLTTIQLFSHVLPWCGHGKRFNDFKNVRTSYCYIIARLDCIKYSNWCGFVWFGLFVHPLNYTCNGHINYRLQFTTQLIWTSTQYNIINNNTKYKDQLEVEFVTTSRNMCIHTNIPKS